jgi:hypothetical protein
MDRRVSRLNSTPRLGATRPAFAGWVLAVTVLGLSKAFATTPCAGLVTLSIPNTTITGATMVPATGSTPAYCNVLATVAPQTDIQVQLPTGLEESLSASRRSRL